MLNTLKALDGTGFTVHGFRSSFEDWGAEATHFPRKLRFHNDPHSFAGFVHRAFSVAGHSAERDRRLSRVGR
jgi:hypothetical protein